MKVYIKFLTLLFLKSFIYVTLIIASLVFILNLLSELDFFKEIKIDSHYNFSFCIKYTFNDF